MLRTSIQKYLLNEILLIINIKNNLQKTINT